jgi:hypothetical protein
MPAVLGLSHQQVFVQNQLLLPAAGAAAAVLPAVAKLLNMEACHPHLPPTYITPHPLRRR